MQQVEINRPTAADIANVIEEIGAGECFDPFMNPYCWDCKLYAGDQRAAEGQAATPGKAMAYAWVAAHWYDAIICSSDDDYAEQARKLIPPEVSGEQWRFVVRPPSLEVAKECRPPEISEAELNKRILKFMNEN